MFPCAECTSVLSSHQALLVSGRLHVKTWNKTLVSHAFNHSTLCCVVCLCAKILLFLLCRFINDCIVVRNHSGAMSVAGVSLSDVVSRRTCALTPVKPHISVIYVTGRNLWIDRNRLIWQSPQSLNFYCLHCEGCGKVMFLHLSVHSQGGGGYPSLWSQFPSGGGGGGGVPWTAPRGTPSTG